MHACACIYMQGMCICLDELISETFPSCSSACSAAAATHAAAARRGHPARRRLGREQESGAGGCRRAGQGEAARMRCHGAGCALWGKGHGRESRDVANGLGPAVVPRLSQAGPSHPCSSSSCAPTRRARSPRFPTCPHHGAPSPWRPRPRRNWPRRATCRPATQRSGARSGTYMRDAQCCAVLLSTESRRKPDTSWTRSQFNESCKCHSQARNT